MKLIVKKGRTSFLAKLFLQDSSSTTGAGLTGLTSGSSGLVCYRARDDDGNAGATQITLSGGTKGTWSSGGFVEKDSTNMPGVYEIGITDASLATGSETCVIMLKGATNLAPCVLEIQLVAYDPQASSNLGLSALPTTAAGANGGLPLGVDAAGRVDVLKVNGTSQTAGDIYSKVSGLTFTGANKVDASVRDWVGDTIPARSVTGVPKVDVQDWTGTAVATPNTAGVPVVDTRQIARQGTAQATGNSTTAIKLDASASATDSFYVGMRISIVSGTGAPESAICTAYVGSTKIATVSPAWPTAPDSTSVFQVIMDAQADEETIGGVALGTHASGMMPSDVRDISGSAVSTSTAQLGVNAVNIGGTAQTGRDLGASVLLSAGTGAGQLDFTSGVVKANATQWLGGTIPAVNVTGVPKVDVIDWLGTAVTAATAGIPDANVKNYNNVAAATDANNLPKVDVEDWKAGVVPAVNVTGVPLVDLKYTLGTISPATAGSVRADAVTGAVGSVTGAVGSVTGAVGSVTARVTANVDQIDGASWGTHASGMAPADVRDFGGSAGTFSSGIPDVNAAKLGGTSQTGRDIGASVLLSNGTGTGQVKLSSGYVAPNWGDVGNPTTVVNLTATNINGVNTLAAGTDSINTVATSGSTLTTGSTTSGSYSSTVQLDGTYWQIADATGTLDMYFEFNVGATGVPTEALWAGALTSAVNSLKVYAYNWAGSSWDQIGTIVGTSTLLVNDQDFAFTTAHVGTGGSLGLVRLRFQNTGLTSCNFYTDRVLCSYTNAYSFPTNFATMAIDGSGRIDLGKWLGSAPNVLISGKVDASVAASVIANAVLDEALSGHLTSGTVGAAINASGAAGDPWTTGLPGAYGAGTAGYILGTNIDATISSRLASAGYTVPPTANANADALLDRSDAVETGLTVRNSFRAISSMLFGKVTGAQTGTEVFREAVADSKARVTISDDSSGNRSGVTTDFT